MNMMLSVVRKATRLHCTPSVLFAVLVGLGLGSMLVEPAQAHNLDTLATSIHFADDFIGTMSQRASANTNLVQVNDEF